MVSGINGEDARARGPTDRARGLDVGIGRRYSFGIRGRRTSRGGWVRRRTSATVASTSRVSEVVMVWRTMGCSEPSLTSPTVTVLRMEGERKVGSGQTVIQQLRVRCRGRGKKDGVTRAPSRDLTRAGVRFRRDAPGGAADGLVVGLAVKALGKERLGVDRGGHLLDFVLGGGSADGRRALGASLLLTLPRRGRGGAKLR